MICTEDVKKRGKKLNKKVLQAQKKWHFGSLTRKKS